MAGKKSRSSLGRPLDSLLSHLSTDTVVDPDAERDSLNHLAIDELQPGKYQPRKDMTVEALEELANSIRLQGVLQPIVARPVANGRYEIIAGERRWRAATIAGLSTVPAIIKDIPDEEALAIGLIENIQREDLNCMEEAVALQRLITDFGMTHQQAADAVGKSRTMVSNLLRLLSLNDDVRTMVERGDLEMGHARALLALAGDTQRDAARQVVDKGLTVRETEQLVRKLLNDSPFTPAPKVLDPGIQQLQQQLGSKLNTKVAIKHSAKGKGKLVIEYKSVEQLNDILGSL